MQEMSTQLPKFWTEAEIRLEIAQLRAQAKEMMTSAQGAYFTKDDHGYFRLDRRINKMFKEKAAALEDQASKNEHEFEACLNAAKTSGT
jgi:hypothetical protein